jgi:hypothetical protein
MGTVSFHNGLSVNGARGSKMVAKTLSMGKKPDTNHIISITDADTAPTLLKTLRK